MKCASAAVYCVALALLAGCGKIAMSIGSIDLPGFSKISLKLSTNSMSTAEGSTETISLTLSQARSVPTIAKLQLESPRLDHSLDFNSVAATVTIPAGSTSAIIPLTVVDDVVYEGLEDFTITVTSDDDEISVSNANVLNILVSDNESLPAIIVGSNAENILENASSGSVALTMTPPSSQAVMVNYSVTPSGATSGIDYSLTGGVVTFAPGETSKSISYTVLQDTATESVETFAVTLTSITGTATLGTPSAQTISIIDDDAPNLFIDNVTVTEGGNAVFTVSLSSTSTQSITFDWVTANGTGIAGTDYTSSGQSEIIAPGLTTKTITVPTLNTAGVCESDKTFTVTLSNPANASIADASGIGTIQDDDLPVLSVAAGTGDEGDTITHTVTLTPACPTKNVTFNWSTTHVTSSAADLTVVSSQAKTINAGQTTASLSVVTTEDALDENLEFYNAVLNSPGNATLGTASTLGTINDDDAEPTISIANASVTEGNGAGNTALVFTITVSPVSGRTINFDWQASDGTGTSADNDFVPTTSFGNLIPVGASTHTITVDVVKDLVHENNETLNVNLSGGSGYTALGSTLSAVGTIVNDDSAPTLSIGDVTVTEGTGAGTTTATVTVTASAASSLPITVNYATSNGTATLADSDYTSASGIITIPAGQTSQTFNVTIGRDSKDEIDETLAVTLSGGSGYTIAGSDLSGTITITDDDSAPTISVADVTIAEGTGAATAMTFTVTPSVVSGKAITFTLSSTDGTAVSGADFTAPSGTVTLPAEATSVTFNVSVVADSMDEDDETFTVSLSGGSNYTAAGSDLSSTATITDDDLPPVVSIADASSTEGSNLVFVVSLSAASGKTVTGDISYSYDGATDGVDYIGANVNFSFAPGVTSVNVTYATIDDSEYCEPTENVALDIDAAVNATIGDSRAYGSILENDFPKLSISPSSVALIEGGSQLFTVTADQTCPLPMKFTYQTVSIDADTGSDFPNQGAELTIASGNTTATFTINTIDDSIKELTERFVVTAAPYSSGNTTAANGANIAKIEITDNDSTGAIYKVATSRGNSCAISTSGEMRCWGENSDGQLGMSLTPIIGDEAGEMGDFLSPVNLGLGGMEKTLVAASGRLTRCAIVGATLPGDVKCFGYGAYGRHGYGHTNTIGDQVSEMGPYVAGPPESGLKKVDLGSRTAKAITAGEAHACIIDNNNKITCWGANGSGELGRGNTSNHGDDAGEMGAALIDVNLSSTHTVALEISAGEQFTCAIIATTPLATSGAVKCWGRNTSGQLGIGSTATMGRSPQTLGDFNDNGTPGDPTDDTGIPFVNFGTGRTAKRIATGSSHACAILDNDRVKCWGVNSAAQLGLGHTITLGDQPSELGDYNDNGTPLVFTDDIGLPYVDLGTDGSSNPLVVTDIASSDASTCALTNLGMKCWGRTYGGVILDTAGYYHGDVPGDTGNGNPFRNFTWPGAETTVDIEGVGLHTMCARSSAGSMKCWGFNNWGMLGQEHQSNITNVTDLSNALPIKLGTLETVAALVPSNQGEYSVCAVLNSGSLKCWGGRVEGAIGDGMDYYGDESYEMGAHMAGNYPTGASMNFGGLAVKDVEFGPNFVCALFTNDMGACWGNVGYSQDLQGAQTYVTGEVAADWPPPLLKIPAARSILSIAASETNVVCALFDNFTTSCWGENAYLRTGVSDASGNEIGDQTTEVGENLAFHNLGTGRRALKISVGSHNGCALLDDLRVKCWGYNADGSLGQEVANGTYWGRPSSSMGDLLPPINLGTNVLARDLSAGWWSVCAITTANKLKCFGDGAYGTLGLGDQVDRGSAVGSMGDLLPYVDLGSGLHPIKLSQGLNGYCALLNDFSVKCWGLGNSGRLGSGSSANLGHQPTSTGDGLPIVSLASNHVPRDIHSTYESVCVLLEHTSDHSTKIQCWGSNPGGSLGLSGMSGKGYTSGQMGDNLPFVNVGF